ncbi:MAG TPA: hypothetical protein VKA70_17800 [Blastocatellia bacterium]|nr:hypothetical protein [Blastocatellia bacterium]
MADTSFDPKRFIDRESEQERFEELLRFETPVRILAIRDTGGMGKSHLLEKFQHRCRTGRPRTPISLIALDQLPDYSPFFLVKMIAEHLDALNIRLENFTRYENARQSADFRLISSSIDLRGANFGGASDVTIAGTVFRDTTISNVNLPSQATNLNPDQEKTAREVVIGSFFDDLQKYCNKQPIVIMLDSYEKCDPGLQKWIVNHLLEKYFFSGFLQSCRLALIIAGRELPPFDSRWSEEDCDKTVKSINGLRKWEKKHVEEFLRVHGFPYEQPDVDAFYRLIERGIPPSEVIQLMQTYLVSK